MLDSLTAAIRRNPNPLPEQRAVGVRGRGRGRSRGRGGRGIHVHTSSRTDIGDQADWTIETLKAAWYSHLSKDYEAHLQERGVERENWHAMWQSDLIAPREEDVVIKEELKGLWVIDDRHYVVEGECPVREVAIRWEVVLILCCRCVESLYLAGLDLRKLVSEGS